MVTSDREALRQAGQLAEAGWLIDGVGWEGRGMEGGGSVSMRTYLPGQPDTLGFAPSG